MSDNSILCYCTAIKKRCRPEILTQALHYLILYNEMLQMRLENGKYVSVPGEPERQIKLLSIYDCFGKSSGEIETLIMQIIEDLSGEMACERGASMRAAILNIDKDFNKLLLLSHHAIVDPRGLILVLEDLYRVYEQLSNGKKVDLRPVHRTYSEFINDVGGTKKTEQDGPLLDSRFAQDPSQFDIYSAVQRKGANQPKIFTFSITLDKNIKRRLLSWRFAEFGLTPAEALAGVLLRSIYKADEGNPVSIHIKSDYRFVDETSKYTVGAMTQTYILPTDFAEERRLFSDIKKLRGILHDIPLCASPRNSPRTASKSLKDSKTDLRLRLNLEYLTDEPWLGGDEWLPEGFILTGKGQLTGNYSFEITPFFLNNQIEVFVEYKETPGLKVLVDRFAANLAPEIEIIMCYCEGYIDAEEFWAREFAKSITQTKIEVGGDGHESKGAGRASSICRVEKSVMDRALLNFEADKSQLLLAAYVVLASRLIGCEEIVLLCVFNGDNLSTAFPLRLNPSWTSDFKLFVEQVKSRFQQANALGQYALDVLDEEQQKHGRLYPTPDVGYVCKLSSPGNKSIQLPPTGMPVNYSSFSQEPDLVLELSEGDDDIDICFVYEKGRFGAEIANRLGLFLSAILEDVAADANLKLGDIDFEREGNVYDMASFLARDAFNF